MPSKPIKDLQDFTRIINNGRVILIDFHAVWSGWSQFSGQQLLDLSETFKRIGVDLYRVNIDDRELDDVVMEADVRVVPTFMVFKDGKRVGYAEGVDAGNLRKLVGSHVAGWTALNSVGIKEVKTAQS
ncbi:thioredoxin-like protein [Paxillus ammoniavirescens]|nr:thioredoxin-like protein [Paxillus ammoniavirescens]